jgi:single-stranded-DNA-specific exonuclease
LFLDELQKISKIFKSLVNEKNVKILHHLDADGITSAAIFSKMMMRLDKTFEMRMLKQLTSDAITRLSVSPSDLLVLLDFGSGQLNLLKGILDSANVLILDHHEFLDMEHPNLFHLNPLSFSEEELSASMICYLFAKSVDMRNADLIDLAVVGAVGDQMDEDWEFKGMAKRIIEEAETIGKITVSKGLRIYGRSTRPVHKALEMSFDPFIPGISGSESNSVQFLSELGIDPKKHGEWRRLIDLTAEEQQKMASAIIIERLKADHADAENIFGDIYTLSGRTEELSDAREFATLINACGRLGKGDVAIRLCMNDLTSIGESKEVLSEYKRLISVGMNYVRDNPASVRSTQRATHIFLGANIPSTMIGTITSILLSSGIVDEGKPVFGFSDDGVKVKISARASKNINIDLRYVILNVMRKMHAEGGGHKHAAGAYIDKGKEEEFIELIEKEIGEQLGDQEIQNKAVV